MTEVESKNIEIKQQGQTESSLLRRIDPFFENINRWFNDIWRPYNYWIRKPFDLEGTLFRMPLTNITEDEEKFTIEAEIPGLDKRDIEIKVSDGVLNIKGEQEKEIKTDDDGYIRREYKSTSYFRRFDLPENVKEDEIEASLKNGRLEITLPKSETKKQESKTIEVK